MSDQYANNAAGRLASVLDEVYRCKEMPTSQMWWRVLKMKPSNDHDTSPIHASRLPLLYERMLLLNRTLDRVQFQVKQFMPEMVGSLLSEDFTKCRVILSPVNWDSPKSNIDAAAIVQIVKLFVMASSQLPLEGNITGEEITQLIESLLTLLRDVDNMKMYFDKEGYDGEDLTDVQKDGLRTGLEITKEWLKKMIRAMITALELYPFCGITPLDEATAQLIGQRKVNRQYVKFLTRVDPAISSRFGQLCKSGLAMLKRAANPKTLLLGAAGLAGGMAKTALDEVVKVETRSGVESVHKQLREGNGETKEPKAPPVEPPPATPKSSP